MFTLPKAATDDDLRNMVAKWFCLVANDELEEADSFLDPHGDKDSMDVHSFILRVAELTGGGRVTMPVPIPQDLPLDELPVDGPVDLICWWLPSETTTLTHLGFVADILHTIPVDGQWSEIDASFFVRADGDSLSLQLRDVIRLDNEDD